MDVRLLTRSRCDTIDQRAVWQRPSRPTGEQTPAVRPPYCIRLYRFDVLLLYCQFVLQWVRLCFYRNFQYGHSHRERALDTTANIIRQSGCPTGTFSCVHGDSCSCCRHQVTATAVRRERCSSHRCWRTIARLPPLCSWLESSSKHGSNKNLPGIHVPAGSPLLHFFCVLVTLKLFWVFM